MHAKLHKNMFITLKHTNIVEKVVKKFTVKNTRLLNWYLLLVHIGIALIRQFQCVTITYVTKIKETYFEIYTYQDISFASLKHLICQSVLKYLSLKGKLFIFT